MSTTELAPGRPGNLTPEQEKKLRQLWAAIFRVCGVDYAAADDDETAEAEPVSETPSASPLPAQTNGKKADKEKKKKRHIFRRTRKDGSNGSNGDDSSKVTDATSAMAAVTINAEDDKYGQGKVFQDALASMSPETIRDTIWSMVKHDHPDALVLRFLRARKWDVDKALVMFVSTMHWRSQEMKVDTDIMKNGEGVAAELENEDKDKTDAAKSELISMSHDFLEQMRMGKSFLHGFDKNGRPICVVRVRLHHQGDHSEASLERCTVYIIETARMLLQPPVDTATIIFDMTNFSLANMDYSPVRFMIKCFEANYPECLGVVLVHKAPWIFQGIWKIIRGWLDPVVAGKVHFTNNVKDVEQFIERDHIMKELEGDENWEYNYIEPVAGENDRMKDTKTRDKMLAEREALYREFEAATGEWILNPDGEKVAAIKAQRDEIAGRMREDYWRLDPYVRARSFYDRVGFLTPDGTINHNPNWTPTAAKGGVDGAAAPATNGKTVAETSADDVE